MQPLNYCKQMVKQFSASLAIPNFPKHNREILSHAIDLANASQKFLLPMGGRILDDKEYRALDPDLELKLPFPFIALEYEHDRRFVVETEGEYNSLKRIVLVREQENNIAFMPIVWIEERGIWGPTPEAAFPKTGYINRAAGVNEDGRAQMKLYRADDRVPLSDYQDESGAILDFLNALQCSNVRIDHRVSSAKRAAAAHLFDSYRVLTIDTGRRDEKTGEAIGTHRSPREHLRRGHIRRYSTGTKIWVNATVVNAGVGGKVSKDYALRTQVSA